jgi:prepilin-type N-terminal cleavage/methylation domain-containing protein
MINISRKTQRGFTLMEIMVSLVLISLVLVTVVQLSSANLRNLARAGNRLEMLDRANAKMRQILEMDLDEEKNWQDMDDEGCAYDITVSEAFKERTENLPVKFLEITVSAKDTQDKNSKAVLLKTAKTVSRTSALQ